MGPPAVAPRSFSVVGLHAIYERVIVAGPEIRMVRLTSAAYAHGLALALPEKVAMARPPVLSAWESHGVRGAGRAHARDSEDVRSPRQPDDRP